MRIARFTTGEDPQYGVVAGELDDQGQLEDDAVIVALSGDPLYVGIKALEQEHRSLTSGCWRRCCRGAR